MTSENTTQVVPVDWTFSAGHACNSVAQPVSSSPDDQEDFLIALLGCIEPLRIKSSPFQDHSHTYREAAAVATTASARPAAVRSPVADVGIRGSSDPLASSPAAQRALAGPGSRPTPSRGRLPWLSTWTFFEVHVILHFRKAAGQGIGLDQYVDWDYG
jgi:hypothetical protein